MSKKKTEVIQIKVGDKVKLLKDLYNSYKYLNGSIHTVLSLSGDGHFIRVNPDEPENGFLQRWFKLAESSEITKFKVGDKVKVIGGITQDGNLLKGQIVTITEVEDPKIHDADKWGQPYKTSGDKNYGVWESELEAINPADEPVSIKKEETGWGF
jgi:transcription antitermination factor NusG